MRVGRSEIDLIVRRGTRLIFCEVKMRSRLDFGHPVEMVDEEKEDRLRRAASLWLAANPRHAGLDSPSTSSACTAADSNGSSTPFSPISAQTRTTLLLYGRGVLGRATTHALVGLEPRRVEVEAHLADGKPTLTIVGLADRACQEAKERVRSGIVSAELEFAERPRRRQPRARRTAQGGIGLRSLNRAGDSRCLRAGRCSIATRARSRRRART